MLMVCEGICQGMYEQRFSFFFKFNQDSVISLRLKGVAHLADDRWERASLLSKETLFELSCLSWAWLAGVRFYWNVVNFGWCVTYKKNSIDRSSSPFADGKQPGHLVHALDVCVHSQPERR